MSDKGERSSWLEPLPEEYTTEGDMTGRRMMVAALTVIVLAIFGGLIWYSYLEGHSSGPVPVVHADKSVVKIKPDNPGGLQVPDQDKRVFSRVTPEPPEQSEQLGPSAELARTRPGAKLAKPAEKKPVKAGQPVLSTGTATLSTGTATKNITRARTGEKPSVKKSLTGSYLVQLGAFGHRDTAVKLWHKLQKKNTSLLGDLDLDIMMVDLGKKGVFYRLRGGMIADRSVAANICALLKAKKQACIVVNK